jgi:hypothetical protein
MLESSVHALWTRIDCPHEEEHGTFIEPCDEV